MTTDGTTEGSLWHPPGATPTDDGRAPVPPFPAAHPPGRTAPGPQPGYGAIRPPGYRSAPPGRGMALGTLWTGVGSLVLGFISIGVLGIVGGIVGLVLGMVTLHRANRGKATGSEMASFGMAMSLVSIVVGGLLFVSAWPAFVDAVEQGFEQGWEEGSQP